MKRWLWIFAAIAVSTFVYSTIRYGLRPKPIPVLNPTEFEEPQQIGAVVYKGLRQNIRPERLLVLGSEPDVPDYDKIWLGFLKTARADLVKVDVFFSCDGLRAPEVEGGEVVTVTPEMMESGEFLRQVQGRLGLGHMVVVQGLTTTVSHLMKDSLSLKLDKIAFHPVLSLSLLSAASDPAAVPRDECFDASKAQDGPMRLDCARARVGKTLSKKRLMPGKIWGVMERHGLQEYLIFVRH